MINRIIQYFPDTHMHMNHNSLRELAKSKRVDLDALKPGEFVLFTNHPFNAFKLVGPGNTFAYHRDRHEHVLDPRALMLAIQRFDGTHLNYKASLAETIFKRLPKDVRHAIEKDRARPDYKPTTKYHVPMKISARR